MRNETKDNITTVVEKMIQELEAANWARSDRLQKVLDELVKIEIARIEAGKL